MSKYDRVNLPDAFWFQEGPGLRKWQFTTSGIKVLNVGNIMPDGSIDLSRTDRHVSVEEFEQRYTHFGVDAGDLVMASSGISFEEDGFLRTKIAFVEEDHLPLCMNTSTIRFKAVEGVSCLEYLRHWLQSVDFRRQVSRLVTGTAQLNFGPGHLKQMSIGLPPLEEQRRIAGILDATDALRRRRREALALLDTLPGAIFAEMFGALTTSDRFPRGPLSNLITGFDTGKNLAPASDEEGMRHRVLKVSAVTKGEFIETESKPLPADYSPPACHFVKPGDLLFSRANTSALIGATAMVENVSDNIVLPDKIWRFLLDEEKAEPIFLHYLFGTRKFRDEVSRRATGSSGSMKNISKGKVLSIEVGQPPIEMQREFSRRVRIARGTRAQVAEHFAELESLFASLQSRAFAGAL